MRVGARISRRRKAAGLSQVGLARKLPGEIDGSTVSRWELGKSWPKYENLCALAKVLGISEEELMLVDLPPEPKPKPRRRKPAGT